MDQKLEDRLQQLKDAGKQMEALQESIAEKEELLSGLNRTKAKLQGMPAAVTMTDQTIAALEKEIEEEKNRLQKMKASL